AKAFPPLARGAGEGLVRMDSRAKDSRVLDAVSDLLRSDLLARLEENERIRLLAVLVSGAHADGPAVFARLVEAGGDSSFDALARCVAGTLSEADEDAKQLWPDYLKASKRLFDFLATAPQMPLEEDALATVLLHLAETPNAGLAGRTKDLIHKAKVRARPDVREALRAAVWEPVFLKQAVLIGWNVDWLADFEEDLRASLPKSKQPQHQLRALVECGKPVSPAEWRLGLEHEDANVRAGAIAALPRGIDADVRKMLFARLADEDWQVRSIAVEMLNKVVPLDVLVTEGVAGLVPLMRDPNGPVKEAAIKVLDDLRRYQEQRAFWDRFQAGVQTGPEATVSKLLLQAKAGQPKEQRLLAIDALASIGQMDALPYLIEMTTDSDPEIANLARGAVGTLRVNIAQRALQPK
ncbi:MAG: HEAT repeat domain-containing protein, partial [Planctomycetota bacterium]